MTNPVTVQVAFRARGDTVGLNTDTWDYALSTNFTGTVDTPYRVRFQMEETAGRNFTFAGALQYNLNGAGWNTVSQSTPIKHWVSEQYAHNDATSKLLAGSARTFDTGTGIETGTITSQTINNECCENEYALLIDSTQVADGDTIGLRLSGMTTYSVSLTIAVYEELIPPTINLDTAQITAQSQSITVDAGEPPVQTINFQLAQIISNGQTLDIQPGEVTIQLEEAIINFASTLNRHVSLGIAQINANAQDITVSAPAGETQVNLDPALLSSVGQILDVQPGTATINLDVAQINANGQSLSIQQESIVELDTALLSASVQDITISAPIPETQISLDNAQINVNGQSIISQVGPVTINLGVAQISAQGQATIVSVVSDNTINLDVAHIYFYSSLAKTVQIDLDVAQINANGQTASISAPSGDIQINLDVAQITTDGQDINISVSSYVRVTWIELQIPVGATTLSLDTAQVGTQGQALDIQVGDVSTPLDTAQINASAQDITISAPAPGAIQVNLEIAQITTSGQQLDVQPGNVTISLNVSQIIAQGQTITISNIVGTVISLDAAQINSQGRELDIQPGSVSIGFDVAQIITQGQSTTISAPISGIQISLDTAQITTYGQSITLQMGAVSIGFDTAIINASGQPLEINPVPPSPIPCIPSVGGGGLLRIRRPLVVILPEDWKEKRKKEEEDIMIMK